mmetsp:Transcript_425/g.653  ORF Transcript_425/g.653 Transcript_425/m.653 type:complete len:269 (-) Transcript_425:204-1010(-)|eukprot:CAMPEP_0119015216 /NCGR_PEP_ID=MMETSP1176-20130426/10625_1 /TAXON_ID=265551 /ORGANISM="Synedropsis recta cf, Strain CCMP1620" /LENGTH=268 /DNA_ID=CAMNT_0006968489 /DNA_START=89 /DNA_END=895 /DNA_ORIENTATION=+
MNYESVGNAIHYVGLISTIVLFGMLYRDTDANDKGGFCGEKTYANDAIPVNMLSSVVNCFSAFATIIAIQWMKPKTGPLMDWVNTFTLWYAIASLGHGINHSGVQLMMIRDKYPPKWNDFEQMIAMMSIPQCMLIVFPVQYAYAGQYLPWKIILIPAAVTALVASMVDTRLNQSVIISAMEIIFSVTQLQMRKDKNRLDYPIYAICHALLIPSHLILEGWFCQAFADMGGHAWIDLSLNLAYILPYFYFYYTSPKSGVDVNAVAKKIK